MFVVPFRYKNEEAMARDMISAVRAENDEQKASDGLRGEVGTAAAFGGADAGDLDTRLLTLRRDASALRAAVAELERTLSAEGDAHAARIKAMANAIKRKQRALADLRASKRAPPAKAHDLASFDANTMAEWNSIARRPSGKSCPGFATSFTRTTPAVRRCQKSSEAVFVIGVPEISVEGGAGAAKIEGSAREPSRYELRERDVADGSRRRRGMPRGYSGRRSRRGRRPLLGGDDARCSAETTPVARRVDARFG